MKILYGVQGTGNGHIARARVMANALVKRHDIQVDYLFSGRDANDFFDMQAFGDYQVRDGLSFVTSKGAVSKWKTVCAANVSGFLRDVRQLDLSEYDLVLNDFEPVSAWAAKKQQIPSISVSHQAAFTFPVPTQGDNILDRLLTRYFAPCDIQLGVHWYHFGCPIMPPFVEDKLDVVPKQEHILVYLPFEDLEDVKQLLTHVEDSRFECFHPGIKQDVIDGNVHWRKPSKSGFKQSIKHCAGVIANGGFELSSECLQLGKKVLVKPLGGQYEQLSNMITLEQMGLCTSMRQLDPDAISSWILKPAPAPIQFPDTADMFVDWLLEEEWDDTESICQRLWALVQFPDAVQQRLSSIRA